MNFTTILIIVSVFAAITIIALVLMQQSKSDMGSAFGGGGSQSMFGSRGSANFLSRSTSVMVTVLFISCLALAYTYAKRNAAADAVDTIQVEEEAEVPTIDSGVDASVEETDVPVIETSPADTDVGTNATENIEVPADSVVEDEQASPDSEQ